MRGKVFAAALIVVGAILVLSACVPGPNRQEGGSGTVARVSLKGKAFVPAEIVVAQGGAVTFTNDDDTAHEVAGEGWKSGRLEPGETFSHVFESAGSFAIRCDIHPSMTGTVVVTSHLY